MESPIGLRLIRIPDGSLSIFESKEAHGSHKKRADERRKESTDSGIVMTSEIVGLIKA